MPKIIITGDFCLGGVFLGGQVWWTTTREAAMTFENTAEAVDFHRRHCRLTDIEIEETEPCRLDANS